MAIDAPSGGTSAVDLTHNDDAVDHGDRTLDQELPAPIVQLLDLLGARLHFEQNGVRLYDMLIAKLDGDTRADIADARTAVVDRSTASGRGEGPTRDDLVAIRNEELAHVRLLDDVITELGGEPAAVTDAAAREAIASRGLADVVGDPASSVLDALEALVIAELTDHEQWVNLVELARELGRDDLARSFLTAQSTEHTHLSKMRAWISAGRAATRVEVQ